MSHFPIQDYADSYHKGARHRVSTEGNDRLWVHDILHALLGTSPQTIRGEEITLIYQAVLLRDDRIAPRYKTHHDHGQEVTLEKILNTMIPQYHEFIARFCRRFKLDNPVLGRNSPLLSEREVTQHYFSAKKLAEAIVQELGKPFGAITINELQAIPLDTYLRLFDESRRLVSATQPTTQSTLQAQAIFNTPG